MFHPISWIQDLNTFSFDFIFKIKITIFVVFSDYSKVDANKANVYFKDTSQIIFKYHDNKSNKKVLFPRHWQSVLRSSVFAGIIIPFRRFNLREEKNNLLFKTILMKISANWNLWCNHIKWSCRYKKKKCRTIVKNMRKNNLLWENKRKQSGCLSMISAIQDFCSKELISFDRILNTSSDPPAVKNIFNHLLLFNWTASNGKL